MRSAYASAMTKERIWPDFTAHFRSSTTAASYEADLGEIMDHFEKDFFDVTKGEVQEYFEWMENKVKQKKLSPGTMAKKFREMHSFAKYVCENRTKYEIGNAYKDWYYPYLKHMVKPEKYARSVPPEHIDRLLAAAQHDCTAYGILVLLYRTGLSSTEIAALKPGDFTVYENGVYAQISGRRDLCFIPDDVFQVVRRCLAGRSEPEYLFSNRQGRPLNLMYISRLLRKYEEQAGIPLYSAQSIRNSCGFTAFAYGADVGQTASRLGITEIQVRRYRHPGYRENLQRQADQLMKLKVLPPEG